MHIKRVPRDSDLPLSFAQQRLWFLYQWEPDSPAYNIPAAFHLQGPLVVAALEQSLNEVIRRHEALRTTFVAVEGQAIQVIAPTLATVLPVVDLQTLPEPEREALVQQLVIEEAQQPFDLARVPLVRATLLRLSEEEHIFLLTMHHIVSDVWSIEVFNREVAVLYEALSAGRPSPLPELPIQYMDFVHWQRDWLQEEVLEAQLAYWRRQLGGSLPMELPTDRPRPAVQAFRGVTQSLALSNALTEALKALSHQEGVTLFVTLLAAFKTLLYRYTGQGDISVGSPVANRNRAEIEGLIGFFVNTLVLGTDLGDNPSFRELLGRVRGVTLEAYAHQDLPFEMLVEELEPERDLSRSPLFQVMFILHDTPTQALALPDLTMNPMKVESKTAQFDLTLSMEETEQGLRGTLEYNTDLFDAATITRMAGHLQTLLEGIVANPDQRLRDLPLLTEAERCRLLVEWNDTEEDYPQDKCIHHSFEDQVERTPDTVAVVFEDQHLTYRELNWRANQLAHCLRMLGVGPETLVGVCLERSLEMVVGLLGILKAGGAYVPLDPKYPQERVAFMLADTQAPVLLTQQRLMQDLPEHSATTVCLDTHWDRIAQSSPDNPVNRATPQNLAYVIYTSGSTGTPKGVAIEHRSTVALIQWAVDLFGAEPFTGTLASTSICFDLSIFELFVPLSCAGKVILVKDALHLPHVPTDQEVTLVNTVPSAITELLRLGNLPSSVHTVNLAGEPLKKQLVQQIYSQETVQYVFDLYGPSEDTTYSTFARRSPAGPYTIGRPIANTHVYLLDPHLKPVPIGVPGELCLGGAGLARGYLNRPKPTADSFIPNPFNEEPGARLYKTGDLARYLPDGNIEFLGRMDHQVKIRGFRIELGEIETVLAQHSVVRETAVLAREDTPGDKRLVAYVVPHEDQKLSVTELRRFLKEKLPEHMVPSVFVTLEALPLTPNGKVNRRALPAPEWVRPELESAFVAPRTPIEQMLAGTWTQVLGIEQIGVHDSFFELGGQSLLATQVISRLRDAFQVEVPLQDLFKAPTVIGLAERIETMTKAEQGLLAPSIKPVSRDADLPLSFAQQRLWFLDRLEPDSPTYNIPSAFRVRGPLNVTVLEQSLNEIIGRHEALRTTFATKDGRAIQVIAPALSVTLLVVDLQDSPEPEQVQQLIVEEARRPFNLAQGPLLRASLLRLAEDEHVLLLTMHHIVSDDWSMGIFTQELAALYEAFSSGSPSPLAELAIQYADFAAWQREWLRGKVLETQFAYWKQQLGGSLPVLELPADRPRPPVQTYRGALQSWVLPEYLVEELKVLSQQEGVTLFMTLLAAFKILLYHYTGQTDISVGSPIANRNWSEVEGLIGFFVNTLVLHTDLGGNPTFRELLGRVREMALGAYAHQDLPFEALVEELQPERDVSRNPLFQIMFAFQNASTSSLELPGLTLDPLKIDTGTAMFDLTLFIDNTEQGLVSVIEYNTDLFDDTTIARMIGHYETLLQGIVAAPEQRLADLPLLTETERQQLLVIWNETQTDDSRQLYIHQLFEAQAARTPDAVAVVFESEHLTYKELNRRTNQLAHHLRRLGVGPEVLVGICVERSVEMVVGVLGTLKAGGAYVPLDPTYPQERLAFMLNDAHVPLLLTQARLVERLPAHEAEPICLDTGWKAIAQESGENPDSGVTPENLVYVIYTSGSTGKPKGTLILHRGLMNYLTWCQRAYPLAAGQGAPVHSSLSFDLTVTSLFAPLLVGRRVRLLPEGPGVDLLGTVLRSETNYSLVKITPAHLELLSQLLSPEEAAGRTRAFIIGGENLLAGSLAFWQDHAVETMLVNEYGPTETVVGCCVYQVPPGERREGSVPIGRPIINTQLYILDARLQPVPIGVPGELYIGGACVARGYLDRPELTAERFVPDPFSPSPSSPFLGIEGGLSIGREEGGGARLYRTGDLARYLPDGNIEFLGRIDHQVKVRGFRIELGEIEAVLRQHPAVQETVAVVALTAREDEPDDPSAEFTPSRAEGLWLRPEASSRGSARGAQPEGADKRLVAYVVPSQEPAPAVSELRRFLQAKLPDYMVPSAFVMLEALPLTPNGKVNRRALPPSELGRLGLGTSFVPARTPVEEMLVELWTQVLGIKRLGVHDNFFELGGHSLLATQITARLHQLFGHEFTVRILFDAPTIAELAGRVERTLRAGQRPQAPPIKRVPREGAFPLSFAQQQLWLIDQLNPGNSAYHSFFALRLVGSLDIVALQRSLNEIVRRHDSLRATFAITDGQPVQVIAPTLALPLPVVDLCEWPTAERTAQVRYLAQVQARRPFDLAKGPLIRATLLQLGAAEYFLLLTMHHIVVDGWSVGVLFVELETLYTAFTNGKPSPLPDLPIRYVDFACWQREWLQGEELERQLAYWNRQLEHAPAVLQLPTDRPRPPIQTLHGARQSVVLPKSLSEGLEALSQREGVTLFMTLLAAFKALLWRYTGQTDIVVGSPVANRNRPEVEGLVGYFVNTLVLRTSLAGNPTFYELLTRVRETALDAYVHQELPFEKLVEALQPEREKSYNPLFQVMFILQNAPVRIPTLLGLSVTPMALDVGAAQFDLTLEVEETERGMSGAIEYNTDLFDEATIAQMLEHYQTLLENIVADPGQPISTPLLSVRIEKRQFSEATPPVQRDTISSRDQGDSTASRGAALSERRAKLPAAERALLEKLLRGE